MFKRRQPLSRKRQIRELLWPSMGWMRALHYTTHRLLRLKDSTYSITCGLATGTSVSFIPLPGTHILQGAGFAWLLRGNLVSSVIGTLVGNPWTLPFMWWSAYKIGKFSFQAMGFEVRSMPAVFDWANLLHEIEADPWGLLLPWVFGGYIMAIITWPVSYAVFYWLIIYARRRRVVWKQKRMHRIALSITDPQS